MRSLSSSRPVTPGVSGERPTCQWFQVLPSDAQIGLRSRVTGVTESCAEQVSLLSRIDQGVDTVMSMEMVPVLFF